MGESPGWVVLTPARSGDDLKTVIKMSPVPDQWETATAELADGTFVEPAVRRRTEDGVEFVFDTLLPRGTRIVSR